MTRGKFITLEGTEGAGKSTALNFLREKLLQAGYEVITTREPGGTQIAEEIRKVLLHSASLEQTAPLTELLLMFAARAQHIAACIEPALAAGKWVISDRYVDASFAYQGAGRGIDVQAIAVLEKMIVEHHYPDLTILLDIPAEQGFQRAIKRNAELDRIEQEKIDFFIRVRNAYLERAAANPERIKVIDAGCHLPEVQQQLSNCLSQFIARIKQ